MSKSLTPSLAGQRVVVIGGGLAGLTAARALVARGAAVHLVEARARLGGRVWTVRDKDFADVPLELGGEFIAGAHTAIRSLCQELKLTLVPVLKDGIGLALDVNGRVQLFNSQRPLWNDFTRALAREVSALRSVHGDWNSTIAQALAGHSMQAVLQANGASRELLALAQALRGVSLADADQLSALAATELAMQDGDPGSITVLRIKGGTDRLVQALARQKGLTITLEAVVDRIEQGDRDVRVHVADASKKGTVITGHYVVLATPAPIARAIEITPAVPSTLRRAWQALDSGPATKAHARFDKSWWRKPGRPRAWASNLDTGTIWETSATGPASLTLMAGGRASRALRDLLEEGGPQRVFRRLSWLGDTAEARDFRSISWELDPFARGGYAVFTTAFKPEWRAELARAVGRIAMAGDHTSQQWLCSMNGAVESGQRAARDIEMLHAMGAIQAP